MMSIFSNDIFLTVAKMLVGFIGMIAYINLAGVGHKTTLTTTDQVQNFVLGGIIGGVLYNGVGIGQFIFVLFAWGSLVYVERLLKMRSDHVKKAIDGQPIKIIDKGKLLLGNLKKASLSAHDLGTLLRMNGVVSIEQVRMAQIESNGQLTITNKEDEKLGVYLINDGNINYDALEDLNLSEKWLLGKVYDEGFVNIQDIYLAEYFNNHLNIFPFENPSENIHEKSD